MESWASAWPNLDCCSHLESEAADGGCFTVLRATEPRAGPYAGDCACTASSTRCPHSWAGVGGALVPAVFGDEVKVSLISFLQSQSAYRHWWVRAR